ncbi:BgtE-20080 [Blumeria graminis f. sp. tritici]|uniref:BgtE-20080 n=3 Tax=Blumeria graminis TaxID=34373 RepID=A0A9X9MLQ6_BLUGR|nr:BgtE-20080 [Blumeria graminis f. sp. tritici]
MHLIRDAINTDIRKNNDRSSYLQDDGLETRKVRISYSRENDPAWGSWVEYGSEGEVLIVYSSYGECTGQ